MNANLFTLLLILFKYISGPRKPVFYVPSTPEQSSSDSEGSTSVFSQDTVLLESDSDEGESTVSLANKMGMKQKECKFRFRSLEELNKLKPNYSPTSSPIPLPSPEKFDISSDEDLEMYMAEVESSINEPKK